MLVVHQLMEDVSVVTAGAHTRRGGRAGVAGGHKGDEAFY